MSMQRYTKPPAYKKIDYYIDYGLQLLAPVTGADCACCGDRASMMNLNSCGCSAPIEICLRFDFFPPKRLGFVRSCKR